MGSVKVVRVVGKEVAEGGTGQGEVVWRRDRDGEVVVVFVGQGFAGLPL